MPSRQILSLFLCFFTKQSEVNFAALYHSNYQATYHEGKEKKKIDSKFLSDISEGWVWSVITFLRSIILTAYCQGPFTIFSNMDQRKYSRDSISNYWKHCAFLQKSLLQKGKKQGILWRSTPGKWLNNKLH